MWIEHNRNNSKIHLKTVVGSQSTESKLQWFMHEAGQYPLGFEVMPPHPGPQTTQGYMYSISCFSSTHLTFVYKTPLLSYWSSQKPCQISKGEKQSCQRLTKEFHASVGTRTWFSEVLVQHSNIILVLWILGVVHLQAPSQSWSGHTCIWWSPIYMEKHHLLPKDQE